ncbi:MAG: VTT domain-containing protein [Clostridiales bacterium]|nr:VTT domain-containing protein [Clostridiales bacterium]
MSGLIHFVLNLNTTLPEFVGTYGWLIYPLLFLIIFLETGIVVTPFLPGDSIIFAAAALCAMGKLSIVWLAVLLIAAAILGNMTNYFIGRALSNVLEDENKLRFIKRQYLKDAQHFFDKYGKMAIVLTRFIPIVRTFIPFISGVGRMKWRVFMIYNCLGGILWVALFSFLGYMFGNIPIVQKYYDLVIIGIVCISIIPIVVSKIISVVKKQRMLKAGGELEKADAAESETEESTK